MGATWYMGACNRPEHLRTKGFHVREVRWVVCGTVARPPVLRSRSHSPFADKGRWCLSGRRRQSRSRRHQPLWTRVAGVWKRAGVAIAIATSLRVWGLGTTCPFSEVAQPHGTLARLRIPCTIARLCAVSEGLGVSQTVEDSDLRDEVAAHLRYADTMSSSRP